MANWQMLVTTGPNVCALPLKVCLLLGHGICSPSSRLGKWFSLAKDLPDDAGLAFKMVHICRPISKRLSLDTSNQSSLSLTM